MLAEESQVNVVATTSVEICEIDDYTIPNP